MDHPKILALRADPEITRMLEEGRLWALLQDDRLIEAANDPDLARQLKTLRFQESARSCGEERNELRRIDHESNPDSEESVSACHDRL